MGQGLQILQAFTEDRKSLPDAIEKATKGIDQARDPARRAGYDNATEEAFSMARDAQAAFRAHDPDARFMAMQAQMLLFTDSVMREGQGQASLQPLLAIARALSLVQGRKSLLYFSEGLTVPPAVEDLFQTTVSTANRSNVSVYAFDARGLRVRSPSEETKLALGLARDTALSDQVSGAMPDEAVPTMAIDPLEMSQDALRLNRQGVLRDLAESTGGFLVAETNDLRPGLERVVADLRAYYEVGYVPPNPKADGRWRAISVKVSRPGVVVRTRRGYYAMPPGAPVVLPYEMALAEALAAQPMPREVEHRAATLRFAGGGPETETLLWVEVPHAGLSLARGETTYHGRVSLLGQVKDENGTLVARLSHEASIEGPLAELEAAQRQTTVVKRTLRLPPGRYVLETAVQDRESGRVGARRSAFEIPAPAPALNLGSVAIVRADEVGSPGTQAPGSSVEPAGAPNDPLRAGHLKATPLLGRAFPEGTPAVSLLLSLYAGPAADRPAVELEFRKDGQTVAHATPQLPAPDAGGRITYVGSFPTGSLGPGRYEVWARGRIGEVEASEATAFTLTPRVSPAPGALSADASGPQASAAQATSAAAGTIEDKKGVTTPLATILERAGRYVKEYEETFRNLVAEEIYRQWGPNPNVGEGQVVRTLRSELVFVRLPGPLPWGTFRDVFEVDGQKVRDRERRLEKLFFAPKASDIEQADAILNESSRYNLGRAYRNVNVPALGLLFLRPENQKRLAFKRRGTRTIDGFHAAEVAFEEKASPTLVHDRWMNDVPASGRFWIDETRGTVLRTEIEYDLETEKRKYTPDSWERGIVSTEYRREAALGCFVPDSMSELYNFRGLGRIDSVARYSKYRRFEVSVATAAVLPMSFGADAVDPGRTEPSPSEAPPAPKPGLEAAATPGMPRPAPAELVMMDAPELPGAVGSLLQKAGQYVVRYEQAFRNVAAEERYEQTTSVASSNPQVRLPVDGIRPGERMRSEVVFSMLPGAVPWNLLRDVLEVDGHVQRETGRLEPLFRASPSAGLREANAITSESERLILGPTKRTLNVPTMALAYLHPDNRDAFRFERRGRAKVGGQETVEIAFLEVGRPTLNQDGAGADVPIRGRFWVRESDGAVLRSRTELAFAPAGPPQTIIPGTLGAPEGSMTVTTEYGEDPGLGLLAPLEMVETLQWTSEQARVVMISRPASQAALRGVSAAPPLPVFVHGRVEGRARYSGFHRVGAEEGQAKP